MSETFLQKPDFVDKVVDIINRTRSAKESEPATSKEAHENGLTTDDLNDILSKTQNDPSFDEIVNDIVNKYLQDYPEPESTHQTSTSSEKPSEESNELEEIPIKQRLRPRSEKKTPITERKKKINIISNEPYTGVVPEAANLPTLRAILPQEEPLAQQNVVLNLPIFVQNGVEMIPVLQSITQTSKDIVPNETIVTPAESTMSHQSVAQSKPLSSAFTSDKLENENIAKTKETTPKIQRHLNFLESKCKSTPRRKATHVRILDFNHTPSNRKLNMIKEFSTPLSSGIPTMTPGSAPATIASCKTAMKPEAESVIDENSNSNSISHTPKLAKTRRRRKIAVSKSAEKKQEVENPESLKNHGTADDEWFTIRQQSKALTIDQIVRNANEKAEAEGKIQRQKRRTPKRRSIKKKVPVRSRKSLTKSPDEQKENKEKNCSEDNSTSIEYDENKPLIKFKIKSPRKTAALKNTPKKKKKKLIKERSNEKVEAPGNLPQEDEGPSSLNRSDTVQEVATMLTNLSETILAKDSNVKSVLESNDKSQNDTRIDSNPLLETPFKGFAEMLETPFKDNSLTPLPNTPRFAIPLVSQSAHETPMPKIFSSSTSITSLVKICDILTPSFPITPGIKETPFKDGVEGSPSASGYSSRRTDYSSCSSYYKPDESEDINPAFLNPRPKSERTSQSESDAEKPLKIIGSSKQIECPGAIERVKSFNEEQAKVPHYTMMDEGLLSESMVTTATDESDSQQSSTSSFTCSTCSTDPSDDENTMDKLNKVSTDVDSEWHCDDPEVEKEATCSPAVVDEKTGEVRFPLRNWITPKKLEVDEKQVQLAETNKIKSLLNESDPRRGLNVQKDHERRLQQLKEVRQRTLEKIRVESAAINKQKSQPVPQQKFKRSNLKSFKLPSEQIPKALIISRKDQILQQNLTERPRPTPLKLIPSSSSRRKSATPRKTIVIDELPRQPSPIKKKRDKKTEITQKSQEKLNRLSLDSVNDNAVMPETSLYASLNISSSVTTSFEEDASACTVVDLVKSVATQDESNTFQRTLIAQGFGKSEAKELQCELIDKLESEKKTNCDESESGSEDEESDENVEEEELVFVSAKDMKRTEFSFKEPENFLRQSAVSKTDTKISPMIINFEGRKITLKSSGIIEVFTIDPSTELFINDKEKCNKNKSPKKNLNAMKLLKSNGKESPMKNEKVAKVMEKVENLPDTQESNKIK